MAARAGDPRAAAVLWDRFSPQLRGMMRRTLGPGQDVEELLLQVYVELFRHVGGLRDVHALRPFAVGLAIRVMRADLRRRYVRRLFRIDRSLRPNDATARGALARLYAAFDGLGPDTRLAFTLHHFEGMQVAEIAETLGLSAAAIQRRMRRASRRALVLVDSDPWLSRYEPVCDSVRNA
jgi:RNA polymerase sigma-70 factor, ECF subfamily